MITASQCNAAMRAIGAGQTFEQSGLPSSDEARRFWATLAKEMADMQAAGQAIGMVDEFSDEEPEPVSLSAIHLPDVSDVSFPQMIGAIPVKPRQRRRKYRGVRLSRRPTDFERDVLSLSDIPRRFEMELSAAIDTIAALRRDRIESLETERPIWLAEVIAPIVAGVTDYMARYGAYELRRECARQGLQLAIGGEEDPAHLNAAESEMVATSIEATMRSLSQEWASIEEAATRRRSRALKRTTMMELCAPHLSWGLKMALRGVMNEAFALGRRAEIRAIVGAAERSKTVSLRTVDDEEAERLVDYVIQSAIMDTSTCEPCAEVDGRTFEYDDDDMLEHQPPYYKCDGGDRCRCVQIYVLKGGGYWTVREGRIK